MYRSYPHDPATLRVMYAPDGTEVTHLYYRNKLWTFVWNDSGTLLIPARLKQRTV